MSDITSLSQLVYTLQNTVSALTDNIATVTQQNAALRSDMELLKSVVNRQAATIATLDSDIDNLGQYGRRENIVFTNLDVTADKKPDAQVTELCRQIGVVVDSSDLVDCHPLPSREGGPARVIARFHDREKARKVFSARKKTKQISGENKNKLAARKDKGFGILPNLTVKRNKLYAQVKKFCDLRNNDECWVDTNSGKILLRVSGATRGRVIRNTRDLVEIDNSFEPDVWYFCSAPNFPTHSDKSSPMSLNNLSVNVNENVFSPVPPGVMLTQPEFVAGSGHHNVLRYYQIRSK